MDILEEVNARYETLSQVQKRIADYIFVYPDEVCFCSLKALSASLGVTEVTILRFVKKIGLSSFVELKSCLRDYIQNRLNYGGAVSRVSDRVGKDMYEEQDKEKMFQDFIANEQEVIRKTYDQISTKEVLEAVSLIKQAQMVYVTGGDLVKPVSAYMARRLLTIGIRSFDLGAMSTANFNAYVSGISPEDVVILFTLPGYTRQLINTAKFLRKNRVPIILITDKMTAPAAAYATTVLLCDNRDLFFYNSPLGAFSVASLLAYFTAMENPEETNRLRGRISEVREAVSTEDYEAAENPK